MDEKKHSKQTMRLDFGNKDKEKYLRRCMELFILQKEAELEFFKSEYKKLEEK